MALEYFQANIQVSNIESRQTQKGKQYFLVTGADGAKYSTWSDRVIGGLRIGAVATVYVKKDEKGYLNLVDPPQAPPAQPQASAPTEALPPPTYDKEKKSDEIRRMSANNTAVALCAAIGYQPPPDMAPLEVWKSVVKPLVMEIERYTREGV
jgi:hypothetical protein